MNMASTIARTRCGHCHALVLETMLKVSTKEREGSVTFVLEGRLCGDWAAEAEKAWSRVLASSGGREVLLDLGGVTFIDRAGEALLSSMLTRGTKVRGSGVMVNHLIDQVQEKVSRR
jgi:anti-anti-sigma regulatory factor